MSVAVGAAPDAGGTTIVLSKDVVDIVALRKSVVRSSWAGCKSFAAMSARPPTKRKPSATQPLLCATLDYFERGKDTWWQ